ncbi:suppressor of fused domain protein [Propionibacteriaceae bacterium Y2011]
MITESEYRQRAEQQDDWAPGWDAIDEAFAAHYPGIEPKHYGTNLASRAQFGGTEYLDGISLFPTAHRTQHMVTYGMSTLYTDVESYGGEHSGWGYEMTMQIAAADPQNCGWALSMLSNVARYTWTSKKWFDPYQLMVGRNEPIAQGSGSELTGFITIPDVIVDGVGTVHGRVEFVQVIGITQAESDWITAAEPMDIPLRCRQLGEAMVAAGNTFGVTDLARTTSYV